MNMPRLLFVGFTVFAALAWSQVLVAADLCLGPTFKGKWRSAPNEEVRSTLNMVGQLGVSRLHLVFEWADIETDQGQFDWAKADAFFEPMAAWGMKASVVVTSDYEYPGDIMGKPITDPLVQSRHEAFISQLVSRYKDQIDYLWIGNEMNLALPEMQISAQAFGGFVDRMIVAAKSVSQDIKAGTMIAFPYEGQSLAAEIIAATQNSDLVAITYYPEFTGANPVNAQAGFDQVDAFAKAQGVKYAIVETGWSTNAYGSDSSSQEVYLQKVFDSLSNDTKPDRAFLCWWGLHDPSLRTWERESFAETDIVGWIESLGILDNDGTPKPAWTVYSNAFQGSASTGIDRPAHLRIP